MTQNEAKTKKEAVTLKFDPERINDQGLHNFTGIYVRAVDPDGKWDNADIAELDRASLKAFLRSRGGRNTWAENVVAVMLGHDQFEPDDDETHKPS